MVKQSTAGFALPFHFTLEMTFHLVINKIFVSFKALSHLLMKQGNTPSDLPPWMKFLHVKLANPATHLNIRLFISKLIINTEEVSNPLKENTMLYVNM